jgi:formate--tetrahydrofolate ligase
VTILPEAQAKLKKARKLGYGSLPICMAKTQDSLSDNAKLRGRPRGFKISVRDLEIAAGAGFWSRSPAKSCACPASPSAPPPSGFTLMTRARFRG